MTRCNRILMTPLQLVGTDHCTFTADQKRLGRMDFRLIPNGVNGLEERMPMVWEILVKRRGMSRSEFVRITSTEAARIFNIYPQKGVIRPGSDADVIILNPDSDTTISASTHHSKVDVNVYEGMRSSGRIEVTISRGEVVWMNGVLSAVEGRGRLIATPPFSPYVYEKVELRDGGRKAQIPRPHIWTN